MLRMRSLRAIEGAQSVDDALSGHASDRADGGVSVVPGEVRGCGYGEDHARDGGRIAVKTA
jgi:hypothetical protein